MVTDLCESHVAIGPHSTDCLAGRSLEGDGLYPIETKRGSGILAECGAEFPTIFNRFNEFCNRHQGLGVRKGIATIRHGISRPVLALGEINANARQV